MKKYQVTKGLKMDGDSSVTTDLNNKKLNKEDQKQKNGWRWIMGGTRNQCLGPIT